MKTLEYPANSPDLNPIEYIWAIMKHRIAKEYAHITSQAEMKRVVQEMQDSFGDDEFNHLIESMLERIEAVIKVKGGSTKYQVEKPHKQLAYRIIVFIACSVMMARLRN